ncbi:MAG: 50S ribosomal protein L12 [Candidatus Heimdallarchaeaceae archaeon]
MEYVYTTLLLHEAKQEINEESVKKVLTAANISVNEGKVKALVASLADVNIDEAIKEAPVATVAPKEEKKEEKKEEPKVDENKAAAGLGSLFG